MTQKNTQNGNMNASGFPTALGAWGPLFAGYYDSAREPLPYELEFWEEITNPHKDILEIGAGNGFISRRLIRPGKRITLVEPEAENLRLLEKRFDKTNISDCEVNIVRGRFETVSVSPQDIIIFPYDSLPIITDPRQRGIIVQLAAERLKTGGLFVIHISSPIWAEKYIQATTQELMKDYTIWDGSLVQVKRVTRRLTKFEYLKFIAVQDYKTRIREHYIARTSIIQPHEILEHARSAGLEIVKIYSDFQFSESGNSDDLIFVLRK